MSNVVMQNLRDAVSILKTRFEENLRCIETGTIRSYTEKHESTRHISESLDIQDSLISVDVNPNSIQISKDICKECSNVQWICSNSIEYLKGQKDSFHLAFLDSANNRDHIFEEFKLLVPWMVPGGIIIVDDAGVTPDGKENLKIPQEKGRKISEFLLSLNSNNFVKDSLHGTQLWIDLEIPVHKTIRKVLEEGI